MNHRSHVQRSPVRVFAPSTAAFFAAAIFSLPCAVAHAADSAWLPFRDQNPFVLGSGLPLLPQPQLTGQWSVDASIVESNTQLISSENGRFPGDPGMHVVFGAETRESRVTVGYAFDTDWSARVSLGDEWIGVGFLDKPIQHFHKLIGAPKGFRGGRLGEQPPVIRVSHDDTVLYSLNQPGQALAPLLFDVTRTWNPSPDAHYGLSLGAKLPSGDSARLSDTGDDGVSIAAFGDWTLHRFGPFERLDVGIRAGWMHANGNDVLPTLAVANVAFGDIYARAPLIGKWSLQLQYDAHGALYRDVPVYLGYAGNFTIGLTRPLGERAELLLGIAEDIPVGHTQDASFLFALRFHPGS